MEVLWPAAFPLPFATGGVGVGRPDAVQWLWDSKGYPEVCLRWHTNPAINLSLHRHNSTTTNKILRVEV
ncbi:unnamed protein product [Lactuca virosa]|uniref:Uncharacterized protein n=1 Tax=Lactuca virosa TaxID=75947 RepID=A0AAU9MHL6_9ASTR|nr:unnamed protein product [Lactuca virosa]